MELNDTLVFAFARMNPPTTGHRLLKDRVLEEALRRNADHMIGISKSWGNSKNPIEPGPKMEMIRELLGHACYRLADHLTPSLVHWLEVINKSMEYKNIVLVCGSDRVGEYKTLLEKYNGRTIEGDDDLILFNFETFEVVSSGDRDADNPVSATLVRNTVKDGDYKTFMEMYRGTSALLANRIYRALESSMGINKPTTKVGDDNAAKRKKAKEEKGRKD